MYMLRALKISNTTPITITININTSNLIITIPIINTSIRISKAGKTLSTLLTHINTLKMITPNTMRLDPFMRQVATPRPIIKPRTVINTTTIKIRTIRQKIILKLNKAIIRIKLKIIN